jgi:hypothetical protein
VTTANLILEEALRSGVRLKVRQGRIYASPAGRISTELKQAVVERKAELLQILSPVPESRVQEQEAGYLLLSVTLRVIQAAYMRTPERLRPYAQELFAQFGRIVTTLTDNGDFEAVRCCCLDYERHFKALNEADCLAEKESSKTHTADLDNHSYPTDSQASQVTQPNQVNRPNQTGGGDPDSQACPSLPEEDSSTRPQPATKLEFLT